MNTAGTQRAKQAHNRLSRHTGLGVVLAQLGFRVCILCTQPSLDSVHCSKSLFMNTVHEHCSRGFQKNKNKKNK